MINVKEIFEGFQVFIQFVTGRIFVLAAAVLLFDWTMQGRLLAEAQRQAAQAGAVISQEAAGLATLDAFIGGENRLNLTFVVVIILTIGIIHYGDAALRRIGDFLPVSWVYSPWSVLAANYHAFLDAWRYHADKKDFHDFQRILLDRADDLHVSRGSWWRELYALSRSWIAISIALVLFGAFMPAADAGRLLAVIAGGGASLVLCVAIERRAYENHFGSAIYEASTKLIEESEGEPLPMSEVHKLHGDYISQTTNRAGREAAVRLQFSVPYFWRERDAIFRAVEQRIGRMLGRTPGAPT